MIVVGVRLLLVRVSFCSDCCWCEVVVVVVVVGAR